MPSTDYPVFIEHSPEGLAPDEYRYQEGHSPEDAAQRALQKEFDQGRRYDPGTYEVTVLVDGEPETFEVVAEALIETYVPL